MDLCSSSSLHLSCTQSSSSTHKHPTPPATLHSQSHDHLVMWVLMGWPTQYLPRSERGKESNVYRALTSHNMSTGISSVFKAVHPLNFLLRESCLKEIHSVTSHGPIRSNP
mmetsp:Transcript_40545/g.65755  ORF Transcript_40545/g.65755 Transcript_40545/m.65755 type:complete len:111 (+) Transcript_40545:2136-2468(+)